MEWVLTSGKTIDEAREKALDQLGVAEDEAEFEVLEEPKPGLFGRVRGEARIRARVRPSPPRPKVERRERRRRTSAGPKSREAIVTSADDDADAGEHVNGGSEDVEAAPTRPARSRKAAPKTSVAVVVAVVEGDADDASVTALGGEDADDTETGPLAASFLQGLAEAFGLESTMEILAVDDDTEVRLHGADLGVLIGPRGQTLTAVQDLTRLVAQRHPSERRSRLRIDIGGYREKRREALMRFTEQVASQVIELGTARALEPMSSADRKVVHDTASGIAGVQTISEGEDPDRRVIIRPADA